MASFGLGKALILVIAMGMGLAMEKVGNGEAALEPYEIAAKVTLTC